MGVLVLVVVTVVVVVVVVVAVVVAVAVVVVAAIVKVNQSHYRPEEPRGFQKVKVPRYHDNGTGYW